MLAATPLALHARTGVAAICFQRREYQAALELFGEIEAEDRIDFGARSNLAWALTAFGQYEEAERMCGVALEHKAPSASAVKQPQAAAPDVTLAELD